MNPTFTDEQMGMLLAEVSKKAEACFATAALYQAIPKKAHLFERWYIKAQKWQAIQAAIEAEALKQ